MKENLFYTKIPLSTRSKDAEQKEFDKLLKQKKDLYDKKENMYKQNELMNEIYRLFNTTFIFED